MNTPRNIPKHPTAIDLIRLLPLEKLNALAADCRADYKVKKLSAMRMMCMMTCAFLDTTRLSQRFIGNEWSNHGFASLFGLGIEEGRVSHSSVSERLDSMPVRFFEESYSLIADIGERLTDAADRARHSLVRVDSSMVQDVLGILKEGIRSGRKSGIGHPDRKQLKYTLAYDGFKVVASRIFSKPEHASEDMTIPKVVTDAIASSKYHNEVYLFDRGVSSMKELGRIDAAAREGHDTFVGRLKLSRRILDREPFEAEGERAVTEEDRSGSDLLILSDSTGHLTCKSGRTDGRLYRFIRLRITKDRIPARTVKGTRRVYDDEILLVTDDFRSSALDICGYYRRRWDIEVFFKFLKQNLSMAHLISSSDNGLRIVLYMMLIVATLVMIFEKLNSTGPKEAIQLMRLQLMNWVFDHPATDGANTSRKKTQPRPRARNTSSDH